MNYIREAIEYLKNLKNLKVAEVNLMNEIAKLNADLSGYKEINMSGMPHGSSGAAPDDMICNFIFRRDRARIELKETRHALAGIEKSMNGLDEESKKLLMAFYIDELSDTEICMKFNMSRATFYREKSRAIRVLAVQLFGIKVIS